MALVGRSGRSKALQRTSVALVTALTCVSIGHAAVAVPPLPALLQLAQPASDFTHPTELRLPPAAMRSPYDPNAKPGRDFFLQVGTTGAVLVLIAMMRRRRHRRRVAWGVLPERRLSAPALFGS